jgi:anaerobic selenocysteine-containing dehydrogenase
VNNKGISRRNLLKAPIGALVGCSLDLNYFNYVAAKDLNENIESKFIRSTCSPNCTGVCGYLAERKGHKYIVLFN